MTPTGRKRLLVIIGAILVVLFVVAVALALMRSGSSNSPDSDTQPAKVEPSYFIVNITNLSENKAAFPMNDTYNIWSSMWQTVNKNVDEDQDYYYGNIRQGSIKNYTTANGLPVVEMLIDLPDIKRTFKLTIEGDGDSGYQAAFITCPAQSELVYPPTKCVGQESES